MKAILSISLFALLTISLLATASSASSASNAEPDFAAIDAYVQERMHELRIPGVALAIVHGNEIVYAKGYGIADPSGRPVTAQTPFMLASLSKPMTALAVMQLVEAGKIELDAPVQKYLAWFRVADEAASAKITVRDLLYHTSGISEASGVQTAGVENLDDDAIEQRVRALQSAQLAHPVGTTYGYSNVNYDTLGMIIQQVTGQPYEDYMRANVFEPLGMTQTFASKADAQQHGLAMGYRDWFGQFIAFDTPFERGNLPSGFIIASVQDVARFVVPHLNGGRLGETQIISAEGMDTILKPIGRKGESDESYAMDWGVIDMDGKPWILKGGALANFKTQIALVPESKWGVITLVNANMPMDSSMGDARLAYLPLGIMKLVLNETPPTPPTSNAANIVRGVLIALVILQVVWLVRSARTLRRWHENPAQRPHGAWNVFWRVLFLPLLNLLVGILAVFGIPQLFGAGLSYLIYMTPDFGYLLLAIGVLGIGGAVVWFVLAYKMLRTKSHRFAQQPAPTTG